MNIYQSAQPNIHTLSYHIIFLHPLFIADLTIIKLVRYSLYAECSVQKEYLTMDYCECHVYMCEECISRCKCIIT